MLAVSPTGARRARRFMGIAEQMGRVLQRTSISVNIKERLDFSCALFGPDGALVANAPHLPVHLGAMSEAVRYQARPPLLRAISNPLMRSGRTFLPCMVGFSRVWCCDLS